MSAWSDEDAELLLRAGDSPSTVARLLGMDIDRVEGIAAERSRAKLEPEERQRIGEIRRELRGEKPEPKKATAGTAPRAVREPASSARTTRAASSRAKAAAAAKDAGAPLLIPANGERLANLELTHEQAHERVANADALRLESEIRYSALAERADELRRTAERERDEARAEMDRIGALLTKEQDLRWAERKDADEKIEQLKAELPPVWPPHFAEARRAGATDPKAPIESIRADAAALAEDNAALRITVGTLRAADERSRRTIAEQAAEIGRLQAERAEAKKPLCGDPKCSTCLRGNR